MYKFPSASVEEQLLAESILSLSYSSSKIPYTSMQSLKGNRFLMNIQMINFLNLFYSIQELEVTLIMTDATEVMTKRYIKYTYRKRYMRIIIW
jgi:hypothetical protein